LEDDYGLDLGWVDSGERDIDIDLFWSAILVIVGCLDVDDTGLAV